MDKLRDLINTLNEYRDAYYNQNKSLVSDEVYDALFGELKAMEEETGIIYSNSPTQTVGYKVVSNLKKVKHNHPLLSLDKTTEIDDAVKFIGNHAAVVMAKMDGLTCSLRYYDGILVSAESRGDGNIGEDITHSVLTFVNVPKSIPFNGELIIDGEAIIDYDTFQYINENEYTEYKNPRNLVSGSVRQLNTEVVARRKIKFIAWKLYNITTKEGVSLLNESFSINLQILHNFGFDIVPYALVDNARKYLEFSIYTVVTMCKSLQFPIDGCVITFDDVAYGKSLGMTGHHPRHSIAYKFYQEYAETTLIDIEWQTTRTGLINPVAIFEPVEIDGTTVTRASLSNVSMIRDLELGIGDTIHVIKANQIIPKITENITRSNTYVIPSKCPSCNCDAVIKNENGRETLVCINDGCVAKLLDKMCNFVSRQGMNINGLSRERLAIFINRGFIRSYSDIYKLYKRQDVLEHMDGFGKTSVNNILDAIKESRKCNYINFFTAIGITYIGKSGAKAIVNHLKSIAKNYGYENALFALFMNLTAQHYDWSCIDDFGYITSDGINEYVNKNREEIIDVAKFLTFADDFESSTKLDKLNGKTFCITGKLMQFPNRDALVAEIEKYGGKYTSSITGKTDYLITNDKTSGSSKNKKAEKLGVTIISELEFLDLCK